MKTLLNIYKSKSIQPVRNYSKTDVVVNQTSYLTTQAATPTSPRIIDVTKLDSNFNTATSLSPRAMDVTKLESNYDLDKYTPYLD